MKQRKIMLISRNQNGAESLKSHLEDTYAVTVTAGLGEALEKLNETTPDLIIFESVQGEDDMFLDVLPKSNEDDYIPIMSMDGEHDSLDTVMSLNEPVSEDELKDHIRRIIK